MLRKLRTKFVAIMMTIFTVMLVLIFALILHFTHVNYTDNSEQQMRSVAMEPFVPDRPDGHRGFMPFPHFVLTADQEGELLSTSGETYYDLSDREFLQELLDMVLQSKRPDGVIVEHMLRYLSVSSLYGETRVVFMDATPEFAALFRLVSMFIPIGLAALAIFLAISIFLANILVKPVEKSWEQQRQFVADASHELKTPLAVLTTNAELLNAEGCSVSDKAVFGENILSVARQMRNLVETLLELARADNGSLGMSMTDFDLSGMLATAMLPFEPMFFEKSLTLESNIQSGIRMKGSSQYLRQVLEILLDNAMKYAQPESTVRLTLERQGTSALLSVANSGPAISQGDLKNIFKRFYRVDKARGGGSYGLGLAIAESIVEQHKGKIWAESEKGVNTFKVRLPM